MIALNIGCHDIHMTGFTNVDNDPKMKPDLLLDCTKLLEYFKEESVDFIYAGHFFEHFLLATGKQIICDIFKVLKTYGTLIATIPDYLKCDGLSVEQADSVIFGGGTHKVLMNTTRLKEYFSNAGFLTVIEAKPSEIAHCPFPTVTWQTCIVGLKHPKVEFHGIE